MTNLTHLNLGRKGRCPHRHWDILPTLPEDHPVPERHKRDRGLVRNTLWHHYSFIGLLCHLRPHAVRERERGTKRKCPFHCHSDISQVL